MGTFTIDNYKDLSKSILSEDYNIPIDLSNGTYEMCLIGLETSFTIPNVSKKLKNNTFTYIVDGVNKTITFEDGNYGINHIKEILEDEIGSGIILKPNHNILKCAIKSIYPIDFTTDTSIGRLLGFNKRKLEPNIWNTGDNTVDIFHVKYILVHSNITQGWYVRNQETTVIHRISLKVNPGYDIIEEPINLRYYRVTTNRLTRLEIVLKDQHGNLIDFRNEPISATVHIRKILHQ